MRLQVRSDCAIADSVVRSATSSSWKWIPLWILFAASLPANSRQYCLTPLHTVLLTFALLLIVLCTDTNNIIICEQEMYALRPRATHLYLVYSAEVAPWRLLPIKVLDNGHMQPVHTAEGERYPSAAPQASLMLKAHAR